MYQAAKRVGVSPPFFYSLSKTSSSVIDMSLKAKQSLAEGFVFAEKGYIQ